MKTPMNLRPTSIMIAFLTSVTPWATLVEAPSFADSICGNRETNLQGEQIRAEIRAAAGNPKRLYSAHQTGRSFSCFSDAERERSEKEVRRFELQFAKEQEKARNYLGSNDSAYSWYFGLKDTASLARVTLLAVQASPDDLTLFKSAFEDKNLSTAQALKPKLIEIAKAHIVRELAKETRQIEAPFESIVTLQEAAKWAEFVPNGDAEIRRRAELRGDALFQTGTNIYNAAQVEEYYKLAHSPKLAAAQAHTAKIAKEAQTPEGMQKALRVRPKNEKQKPDKGADDLEKQLGM